MTLLSAAHLPRGLVIGSPLASSAEWGGRFPPAHSEWHATQDLGSTCPLARCSARSSMQQTCTNPPWGHGTGTRIPPTPLPSRQVPYRSKRTMLLPLPPAPPCTCWSFSPWFMASSSSEIADRQYLANCPRLWAPHSAAPSNRCCILGIISVKRNVFRRGGLFPSLIATPNRSSPLLEAPCMFCTTHSM